MGFGVRKGWITWSPTASFSILSRKVYIAFGHAKRSVTITKTTKFVLLTRGFFRCMTWKTHVGEAEKPNSKVGVLFYKSYGVTFKPKRTEHALDDRD